jgi:anti-sigma B factor antagonist
MPTQNPGTADAMATWYGPASVIGMGVRKIGKATILDLMDSLTWDRSAERFKSKITELLDAGATDFAINLGRVSYVDSTGIGTLLAAHNLIIRAGGTCRFFAAQEHVLLNLKRVHLDKVFTIFDDEAAAVSSC